MSFLQKILRFSQGVKKAAWLLSKGEFETIRKRTKSVLTPNAPPAVISGDIELKLRPKKQSPQFKAGSLSKKVLIVDRNFKRLGSHISLSEIIIPLQGKLKEENIDLHLACLDPRGNLSKTYEIKFELHELKHFPRNMSLAEKYETEVEGLAAELVSFEPDLIYVNSVDMFPVIDAARTNGIPTIWNVREAQNWRLRFADRHPDIISRALACFSYPASLIFVSNTSADNWAEFSGESKSCIIKTAIKPDAFQNFNVNEAKEIRLELGIPKDGFMLLTVGTLCADKGQIDAANAIDALPRDIRRKIHWVFIGNRDPSYVRKIKQAWPSNHGEKNLHFCGHIDACAPYYFAANALVSCSRTEAFPRNILEGKLAGLPIISSNIPGSVEATGLYKPALFYELGDCEDLAEQIKNVSLKLNWNGEHDAARDIEFATSDYDAMVNKYFEQIKGICKTQTAAGN